MKLNAYAAEVQYWCHADKDYIAPLPQWRRGALKQGHAEISNEEQVIEIPHDLNGSIVSILSCRVYIINKRTLPTCVENHFFRSLLQERGVGIVMFCFKLVLLGSQRLPIL